MKISVNDTRLYVDVEGASLAVSSGQLRMRPTVVALHGGPGFDQGYLRPGLQSLARHAQVVFVDLRGQGRSDPSDVERCTLEQMADDVAELCSVLGITRPIVFGHSAGGFVGLHLALRHPSLLGGLILCDSAPTLAPIETPDPQPALADRAGPESLAAAGRMFGGDFSPESVDAFGRLVAPFYAAPAHMDVPGPMLALSSFQGEVCGHFFRVLAPRYDLRPRLGEVGVPTLVVVGREDWVCKPVASRTMARGIPGAQLVEIDGAGHFPFSEEPALFEEAVRAFLARLPPPDQALAAEPK